jgi:hypothetical protein
MDTPNSTPTPARWHVHALDLLRVNRRLRDELAATREVLHVTVEIVADRDRTIAQLESSTDHLRAQLRALMRETTIAAERQAIERARLDAETDARFDAAKGRAA